MKFFKLYLSTMIVFGALLWQQSAVHATVTTVTNHDQRIVKPQTYAVTPYKNAYQSINESFSSSDNSLYNTYMYLPARFATTNPHGGNYQGGIQVGNNLYLVESYADNHSGNLVKIDLNTFNKLGLNKPENTGIIAKTIHYFDPKTKSGQQHAADYATSGIGKNSRLTQQLGQITQHITTTNDEKAKRQAYIANEQHWLTYWQADQKQDQAKNAKLQRTIKADKKTSTSLKKAIKKLKAAIKGGKLRRTKKLATNKKLLATKNKQLTKINKKIKLANTSLTKTKQRAKLASQKISSWQNKMLKQQQSIAVIQSNLNSLQKKNTKLIDELSEYKSESNLYAKVKTVITVGPTIATGHGQTLAYDTMNNRILLYDNTSNGKRFQEINPNNLSVQNNFNIKNGNPWNIAFDLQGHAFYGYFDSTHSNMTIAVGRWQNNDLVFEKKLIIEHQNNDCTQDLSFDAINGKLYILGDGELTTIPVDKILTDKVSDHDIVNTYINSKKEFENISFDADGYAYLTVIRSPEILKSNRPLI